MGSGIDKNREDLEKGCEKCRVLGILLRIMQRVGRGVEGLEIKEVMFILRL